MQIKYIYFLVFAVAIHAKANFMDVPLRSLSLGSQVQLATRLLNHISAPGTILIQDGLIQPMRVDESRSFCSITKYSDIETAGEFESYILNSIEGAFVYQPEMAAPSQFRTTLSFSNKNHGLEISCAHPLANDQRIEELNMSELSLILGSFIQLENIHIIPGDFRPRFAPQISTDLVTQRLKIRFNQKLALMKNPNLPNASEARVGKCRFFSQSKSKTFNTGEVLRPSSFEIVYSAFHSLKTNPSIILRFDQLSGVICEGQSNKRMFDYQDFWDATGKTAIEWVL